MTANAPYYQLRTSQMINATNSTNAAQPQHVHEDEQYDLSASASIVSPLEHHHPSAYLEHFARQTSADHTFEESHNLVELLEAATSVAGQVSRTMVSENAVVAVAAVQCKNKRRRRSSTPPEEAPRQIHPAYNAKRQRIDVPTDPQLREGDCDLRDNLGNNIIPHSSESMLNNARAAGVHSAAALFRPSSEKISRKYTRPPMSKLFMSLQLSPESFLQLQAKAKTYMLDTAHPERQNCIGNRGKGDTDMVKLHLFNCVHAFLDDRIGEQFFGEHAEKLGDSELFDAACALGEDAMPTPRARLTWPGDAKTIISLVTPLMRRMVTNERQRQYAIETRKGVSKRKDKEGSVEATAQQLNGSATNRVEQDLHSTFDPGMVPHHQPLKPTSPSTLLLAVPTTPTRYKNHPDQDRILPEEAETKVSDPSQVKLPNTRPTKPNLAHINVFLVLAPRGHRAGVKLDETRISAEAGTHLALYDWNDFLDSVLDLLKRAKAKYPALRERSILQGSRTGAESLRGLAAAANALQAEHADGDDAALGLALEQQGYIQPISDTSRIVGASVVSQSSPVDPDALFPADASLVPTTSPFLTEDPTFNVNDADASLVPRYIMKTLGPTGWTSIANRKDWSDILQEKAFAVWADGVCNVLVELVDLPVGASVQVQNNVPLAG